MKKKLITTILIFVLFSFVITTIYIHKTVSNTKEPKQTVSISNNDVENADTYEINIQRMKEKMEEINQIEDKKEWYVSYKELVFDYINWIDPPETIYDYLTEDEVRLICRVVETETYQCDFD